MISHKRKGAVHPFGEGAGIVGEKVEYSFAQRKQRRGRLVPLTVGFENQAQGAVVRGQQPCSLLAAQAEARFCAAGVVVKKARVQGTDVAETVLAQRNDQAAQTVSAKEGAALVLRQAKVGSRLRLDLPPQLVAQLTGDALIVLQRVFVHVDLPADTAAVTAGGCETVKVVVKIGPYRKHGTHPPKAYHSARRFAMRRLKFRLTRRPPSRYAQRKNPTSNE